MSDLKRRKPDDGSGVSGLSAPPRRETVDMNEDLASPLFAQLLRDHFGKGSTLRTTLTISLEESAVGGSKIIEVNRLVACQACAGTNSSATCPRCRGERVVSVVQNAQVDFPPGVASGYAVVVAGGGDAADDVAQEPGDLCVDVRVQAHPFLRRVDGDCHTELSLSFCQAALGCKLHIPSLYGFARLTVAPGTQPHSFVTIAGEGFPVPSLGEQGEQERGNMVVKLLIQVPRNLAPEDAATLRLFDKSVRDKAPTGTPQHLQQPLSPPSV